MKRCPNPSCRADNPNDAIYCHMCGHKMGTKAKWPFVLIGIVAFVVAVISGIMILDLPDNENKIKLSVNGVSFNMITVDGGSFSMGATPECDQGEAKFWEKPIHKVTLDGYYIGETEVTQALWEAVMGYNPSENRIGRNYPVNCVSWDDCVEFCRLLSQKTGKRFRLPTEAEWEFAARGGNKSKHYKYSGSNYLYEVAWCLDNSNNVSHPVKKKKPNELGIYDMTGNAWEWCSDYWSETYNDYPQHNPQGPSTGKSRRVHRGGGWNNTPKFCRISYRRYGEQGERDDFRSFRLVMEF